MTLYHITTQLEWDNAQAEAEYRPTHFAREQFIHCSHAHQLIHVANRLFHNQPNLLILAIDPTRTNAPVIEENLEGGTELFPHLYGPLPTPAVIASIPFPPQPDGSFSLPHAITASY